MSEDCYFYEESFMQKHQQDFDTITRKQYDIP